MLAESGYRICFLIVCVMSTWQIFGSGMAALMSGEPDAIYAFLIMLIVSCLLWVVYVALVRKIKGAFTGSYLFINFIWWSVIAYFTNAFSFIYRSGIDVVDPPSSPMAALIGLVMGAGMLCLAAIPMILGGMVIVRAMNERRYRAFADG